MSHIFSPPANDISLRSLHSIYPYPPPADDPRIHTDYDGVVGLTVISSAVDDWMRNPNLRGVYRLLSGVLGKTMVLKMQAGGLKYSATSIEDVLGLAEEIGVVIRDIVAGGEPIYWSDMSCTMLSGMGTLMWAVSFLAAALTDARPAMRSASRTSHESSGFAKTLLAPLKRCPSISSRTTHSATTSVCTAALARRSSACATVRRRARTTS